MPSRTRSNEAVHTIVDLFPDLAQFLRSHLLRGGVDQLVHALQEGIHGSALAFRRGWKLTLLFCFGIWHRRLFYNDYGGVHQVTEVLVLITH